MCEAQDYYLDLIKKCLTNWIYADYEQDIPANKIPWKERIVGLFEMKGVQITRRLTASARKKREFGIDWPPYAHTMIGLKRLDNIQFCAKEILKNGIPGDFFEAGVWRGGTAIFMRAILKVYGIKDRTVWAADSFEGMPKPSQKYLQDAGFKLHAYKYLSVSLKEVKANFDLYGLLDEKVCFLKGWLKDTLPKAPIKMLSLLHIDVDMYESTMESLINLYPKLSPGGYVIIDDYNVFRACREAVDAYRKTNGIDTKIIDIDGNGIYWKRK